MEKPHLPMQWYTRRGGVIRGPFSTEEISRHFILGRLCLTDEVSQDCLSWTTAKHCSELLPTELQKLSSWNDYQQLVIARMQVDEREGERRYPQDSNGAGFHPERRTLEDRRARDNDHLVSQYLFAQTDSSGANARDCNIVRPLLLAILLVTVVFAWLLPIQH